MRFDLLPLNDQCWGSRGDHHIALVVEVARSAHHTCLLTIILEIRLVIALTSLCTSATFLIQRLWAFLVEAVATVASHRLARHQIVFNTVLINKIRASIIRVFWNRHQGIRERPLTPVSLPNRDIHDAGLIVQAERLVVLLMHLVTTRRWCIFPLIHKELLHDNLILLFLLLPLQHAFFWG